MSTIMYGQVNAAGIEVDRYTEASDLRITESGDTRVTELIYPNIITSDLSATPTLKVWIGTAYYNVHGVWKFLTPYIKHNNTWKEPDAIYVKQSGKWRRSY